MIKEKRILPGDDLRRLCIDKNWYTCGCNKEYDAMFKLIYECENVETATIVKIAEDIKTHSDTDYEVTNICFEIAEICHSVFFKEAGDAA
jgi:hypothetical protein